MTEAGKQPSKATIYALARGMFLSLQPRSEEQWNGLPEATRDHWRRRAEAALYHSGLTINEDEDTSS